MIFVTGDIHGLIDIRKLNTKLFIKGNNLTKNDYVICTGDFGLIFSVSENKQEKYWLNWLKNKPWTTLFVDGNHENFERLYELPTKQMFDGEVGIVNESIFHLKRGEIYNIQGNKIFTFGGAESIDKDMRTPNVTWWKQEIPSYLEMMHGLNNLEKHNYNVDYILTHTAPKEIIKELENLINEEYNINNNDISLKITDNTAEFLSEINKLANFKKWYFSHFHEDLMINEKFITQYNTILELGE